MKKVQSQQQQPVAVQAAPVTVQAPVDIEAPKAGFYRPPKLQAVSPTNYQLIDPALSISASQPLLAQPQVISPPILNVQAPIPLVQQQTPVKTVPQGLAGPNPSTSTASQLENLSKADLIKVLLAQLAKEQ